MTGPEIDAWLTALGAKTSAKRDQRVISETFISRRQPRSPA
ncbi:hypothetical protein FuraDRAFT_1713 [Pseudogulbenkiania ferrooxidans 2002]|uniref:Uncharacterized protein n=1 Tax=Pseudogulbenkiania ferrooxidans 2002 TaxID=279714 RepID=B9Z300_9NEIS|nr:hypothetical protein FuraDRAFT_1713 [Pseudogulbenkiania ferrooxidans 2002]